MLNLVKDLLSFGKQTAAAGTAIAILIPFRRKLKTWIDLVKYTCGSTAHLLTIMKPLGTARLAANAATGQAVVVLLTDPSVGNTGAISANDYVVLEDNNGGNTLYKVSGVSGAAPALSVTLGANLTVASSGPATAGIQGNDGQKSARRLWYFGTPSATGHINLDTTVSTLNTYGGNDSVSGVAGAEQREQPLIVYSPNGTAAGIFEQVNAAYLETGVAT